MVGWVSSLVGFAALSQVVCVGIGRSPKISWLKVVHTLFVEDQGIQGTKELVDPRIKWIKDWFKRRRGSAVLHSIVVRLFKG